ncbi:PREDICTED: uncharacterized protein LOC109238214 [Nicotiana attenuata]|uniref:uncharacterized protein LOC109238214 n=1 Tax=Nicotiana attenuata TaxID=49451 RepID=UPI000905534E|nr:PREDICTED: uncharacterized protein LOC109238214 [Nicotiana attenuata]
MGSANFAVSFLSLPIYTDDDSHACMLSSVCRDVWNIDSGATDHMTSNREILSNLTPLPTPYLVTLPNGCKEKNLSMRKLLELGKMDQGLYKLLHDHQLNITSNFVVSVFRNNVQDTSISDHSSKTTHNKAALHTVPVIFCLPRPTYVPISPAVGDPLVYTDHPHASPVNTPSTYTHSPNNPPSVDTSPHSVPSAFPPNTSLPAPRKSSRNHNLSSHLRDFVVQLPPSILSSTTLSLSAAHTAEAEPHFYSQTTTILVWQEAMRKEFEALKANNTWSIVELPKGKKPIGCKWVYKIKYKADKSVERYKARLVVRGDTQVEGIDFHETFSPVVKICTIRCLVAFAIKKGWSLYQLDVNNAFLHEDLDEEVYINLPQGLTVVSSSQFASLLVCKLQKSLYDLRQASRQWYAKLSQTLCTRSDSFTVFLVVYVDDIILTGVDPHEITVLKMFLDDQFKIKDLGLLNYFLGTELLYVDSGVLLHQKKFFFEPVAEYGCSDALLSLLHLSYVSTQI